MTPIQPVLSLFILTFLLYSLAAKKVSKKLSILLSITSIIGLVFVWAPNITEILAHFLGVGRGVDLITYIGLSLNAIVILFLHLRINNQKQQITKLSRSIAIKEAQNNSEPK